MKKKPVGHVVIDDIEQIIDPALVRTNRTNDMMFNQMKNLICKNQDFKMISKTNKEGEKTYELKNFGCDNERALGSSRCGECSLRFKETGLEYPFKKY